MKRLQRERAHRLAAVHSGLLPPEKQQRKGRENSNSRNRAKGDQKINAKNKIEGGCVSILVEIVAASNLPENPALLWNTGDSIINDGFFVPAPDNAPTVDPYVVVRDGEADIHKTDVIFDTVNPVWTLTSGSLFLLQKSNLINFFETSNVLEFTIKNHETSVGVEHDIIGTVMIHKTELLNGSGQRKYYEILIPSWFSI